MRALPDRANGNGGLGGGQQFRYSDDIVGGHREGEHPADARDAAMARLAQRRDRLDPAEGFLDALADALRQGVAGVPGGAFVDRGFARFAGLANMTIDGDVRGDPRSEERRVGKECRL